MHEAAGGAFIRSHVCTVPSTGTHFSSFRLDIGPVRANMARYLGRQPSLVEQCVSRGREYGQVRKAYVLPNAILQLCDMP
jgi:hypothetical protein